EVVPIENAAMEERTCVEWDKDDLDALNILKIDVLGLGMLSCLRRGFDLLNKHYASLPPPSSGEGRVGATATSSMRGTALPSPEDGGGIKSTDLFSLAAVPSEEPEVYRMLSRADTIGVFQVESRAQMSMLPRLKPKAFYDLVIEVAIVRPGPI